MIKSKNFWSSAEIFLATLGMFPLFLSGTGCSTLPSESHEYYDFPKKNAYVQLPPVEKDRIEKLGTLRTKVNFSMTSPQMDEAKLCRNYYHQAAQQLLKMAKKDKNADGIMLIRSVVFYLNGKSELFDTPECSDDGSEGQILLQAEAYRLKKPKI